MPTNKIAIRMDTGDGRRADQLGASARYPRRSRVIQESVQDKLNRLSLSRLAEQCTLLAPSSEQKLAEEVSRGEHDLFFISQT